MNTPSKDESLLEDDLSLNTINIFDSPPAMVHTVVRDRDRARRVPNTKQSVDKPERDSPTTVEKIQAQQQETICRTAATQEEQRNCECTVIKEHLLARKAHIDSAIQTVPSPLLQHCILVTSDFSPLAGHRDQRQIFDTLKQTFCWPHMSPTLTTSYATEQAVPGITRSISIMVSCTSSWQAHHSD